MTKSQKKAGEKSRRSWGGWPFTRNTGHISKQRRHNGYVMPCHGAYSALCIFAGQTRATSKCMGSNRYAPLLCTESSDGGSGAKACARYGRKTKVGRQAPCPFGGEDFFAVLYMRPLHRCRLGALGIAFADNASDMDGMPVHHWRRRRRPRREDFYN